MIESQKFKRYGQLFSDEMSDDVPLTLNSIEDAKNIFEYGRGLFMSSKAAQSSSEQVPLASLDTSLFAKLMLKYSLALQAFIKSKGPHFTPKEEIAIAVLQLHVLASYLWIHIEQGPTDKKAGWGHLKPQMLEMVELAEKVLSSTSPDNNGSTTLFCLDMGVVIPLYVLATQCGDSMIRRKAITLLRSTSRQEGPWNSLLVAEAAERMMEMEGSVTGGTNACTEGSLERVGIGPYLGLDGNGDRLEQTRYGDGVSSLQLRQLLPSFLFTPNLADSCPSVS